MRQPILLIRPDGNDRDAAALRNVGLTAIQEPYLTISLGAQKPANRLFEELQSAGENDWLVITSPRAIPAWSSLVGQGRLIEALDEARVRGLRLAAVGPRSAKGLNVDLVGSKDGSALAQQLLEFPTGKALLPQSAIARRELSDLLGEAGWQVVSASVYQTETVTEEPRSARAASAGNIDGVLLRSPSAVFALARWTKGRLRAYAVGPTTQRAAKTQPWDVVNIDLGTPAEVAAQIKAAETSGLNLKSVVDRHPLPDGHPMVTGLTRNSLVIRNYLGEYTRTRPVWFMRQAGRSLPEYRAIREGTKMLDSCLDPQLAAEITLQPVRRHGVDAAILFSDIVVPVRLAGVPITIEPGVGPVCATPIRSAKDVDRLPELDPQMVAPVAEAARICVSELGATPLIGFAGAPFTVASYLVEGRPSRGLPITRQLMRDDPKTWHLLLSWVARCTTIFLREQAKAGASALQLFDSWAGRLSVAEYREFSLPHSAEVLEGMADLGLPRVHFGTCTRDLLVDMHAAGADVIGVASDIGLATANELLGAQVPLQGNINPHLLTGGWERLAWASANVIEQGAKAPGHVVNLGHGVNQYCDPRVLTHLVDFIHNYSGQSCG